MGNFLTSWGTVNFSGRTLLHGLIWFCIYLWVPLTINVGYCMESGIVQDLGLSWWCYQRFSSYSCLCCVTGQIFPTFQKIIVLLKHCELCIQWYSIISQKLWIFKWKEFYFGTSLLFGCCVSSCLCAGGDQQMYL